MSEEALLDNLLALDEFKDLGMQDPDQQKQRKKQMLEEAQMFLDTFSTEAGQKALRLLMGKFLIKPIANPHDDMVTVGIREGQARLIRWIIQQIQTAEKG